MLLGSDVIVVPLESDVTVVPMTALPCCSGVSWEGAVCEVGNNFCLRPSAAALAALELMARFHKGFQLDPRRLPSPAQAEQALASPVDHSQVHASGFSLVYRLVQRCL